LVSDRKQALIYSHQSEHDPYRFLPVSSLHIEEIRTFLQYTLRGLRGSKQTFDAVRYFFII
jgi:hypothetical protein